MQTQVLVQNGHPAIPAPVVTAADVVRRYGEGDTAVDALRGVSVDIAAGRLTAVMGPSGSGKSTLMHILAGLDTPTSGEVTVAGVDISDLGDDELTKLRRDHIGFIFQFFNLLPMLTAAENIALPLQLAGAKPDQAWLDEVVADGRPQRAPGAPPVRAVRRPAAARRRGPRARRAARASCSPTSRPATSTRRTSGEILAPPARLGRRARPDDRDGHPRRARRGDRRPRPVPRRRRHRPRPRRRPARTRSSTTLEQVSGR